MTFQGRNDAWASRSRVIYKAVQSILFEPTHPLDDPRPTRPHTPCNPGDGLASGCKKNHPGSAIQPGFNALLPYDLQETTLLLAGKLDRHSALPDRVVV
jgi:hypothetical protein